MIILRVRRQPPTLISGDAFQLFLRCFPFLFPLTPTNSTPASTTVQLVELSSRPGSPNTALCRFVGVLRLASRFSHLTTARSPGMDMPHLSLLPVFYARALVHSTETTQRPVFIPQHYQRPLSQSLRCFGVPLPLQLLIWISSGCVESCRFFGGRPSDLVRKKRERGEYWCSEYGHLIHSPALQSALGLPIFEAPRVKDPLAPTLELSGYVHLQALVAPPAS